MFEISSGVAFVTPSAKNAPPDRAKVAAAMIADLNEIAINQEAISEAVGVNQGMISRWLKGRSTPKQENLDKLTVFYKQQLEERAKYAHNTSRGNEFSVPVMGLLKESNGQVVPNIREVPTFGLFRVAGADIPDGCIALVVESSGRSPTHIGFNDGCLIVCTAEPSPPSELVDREAYVELANGDRRVGWLHAGYLPSTFDLEVPGSPLIRDISPVACHAIRNVVRPGYWHKIEKPKRRPR